MERIKTILALLLVSMFCLSAAAQTSPTGGTDIVAKLRAFSDYRISEKAYLHFDKPYYATGDTIYFKAYVTVGERANLSGLSGILHVDLINTANKVDQSIKLQLVRGLAWGDFSLPDSIPAGNYRIRAYTQWMRNEGNYFEQNIPVGSLHNSKVPESSTAQSRPANSKTDLQFFPEGGNLVMGLPSKIAFKAVGTNGLGVNFKGTVTDNYGKVVTEFASTHLGMGYFYLQPQEGKNYTANITYGDGSTERIELPAPAARGIVLSVNNDSSSPTASVHIDANKTYYQENRFKNYSLLIYSNGIAITVACKLDTNALSFEIVKKLLHTGVTRVTLFSSAGEPLCERLIFIQNHDQLNLAVNSNKTVYSSRDKVNVSLNVKNKANLPASGHFSVSVIDESKVPSDDNSANSILSNLLLTSDLKGYIEQPNYYFANNNTEADLDLVMLTHGYRKFEWKQLIDNSYAPVVFQVEKNLDISGIAKSVFNKPLADGTVSLISKRNGAFIVTNTDADGHFKFSNLAFTDTDKFILQAINAKGRDNTKLIYDKDAPAPVVTALLTGKHDDVNQTLTAYLENKKAQQEDFAKYGTFQGKMLKDVTIKDKRVKHYPGYASSLVSPEFADQVITSDQFAKGASLPERIQGALHGIYITKGSGGISSYATIGGTNKQARMRVILDGVDTDGDLDKIDPDIIETVEVLKYNSSVGAYSGFSGSTGINNTFTPMSGMSSGPVSKETFSVNTATSVNDASQVSNVATDGGTQGILIINTNRSQGIQAHTIASIGVLPISPKGFYVAREFYSPKYSGPTNANSRPDLRSTIYWNPELVTDKDGNATFNYFNADAHGTYRMVIEGLDEKGNIGRQVYKYKVE